MADMIPTVQTTGSAPETLRAHFSKKAVLPQRHLEKAEAFIATLHQKAESGTAPSVQDRKIGQNILRTLENKTELFLFNSAVLAGQDAASEADIETRLGAIHAGIERVNQTSDRLRKTLESFA